MLPRNSDPNDEKYKVVNDVYNEYCGEYDYLDVCYWDNNDM